MTGQGDAGDASGLQRVPLRRAIGAGSSAAQAQAARLPGDLHIWRSETGNSGALGCEAGDRPRVKHPALDWPLVSANELLSAQAAIRHAPVSQGVGKGQPAPGTVPCRNIFWCLIRH
jgi:hypothetical protein